jgi:hypothetical protein
LDYLLDYLRVDQRVGNQHGFVLRSKPMPNTLQNPTSSLTGSGSVGHLKQFSGEPKLMFLPGVLQGRPIEVDPRKEHSHALTSMVRRTRRSVSFRM